MKKRSLGHIFVLAIALMSTVFLLSGCGNTESAIDTPEEVIVVEETVTSEGNKAESTATAERQPSEDESTLPIAIDCYQSATNAKDIDIYLSCFTDDAEMIDVSRTFTGKDAIRDWANREVIPNGQSFRHRSILESEDGYAKTEVNWSSWTAHYHYWWNEDGKITKMSLQYAD